MKPTLSPVPDVTTFGSAGTVYAQLFYAGVEQFYCRADSCIQDVSGNGTNWNCQDLECTCRSGTTFCGGVPATDLTGAINGLSDTLGIECDAVDSSSNTATCHFKQKTLQALFGSAGLTLNGCTFGECVRQSIIDTNGNATEAPAQEAGGKPLGGGVIAGLVVVGGLVFLALMLILLGLFKQRAARKNGFNDGGRDRVGVEWTNVSYLIPGEAKAWTTGLRRSSGSTSYTNDKVVLDSVSGQVRPGKMMAILGPSGEWYGVARLCYTENFQVRERLLSSKF